MPGRVLLMTGLLLVTAGCEAFDRTERSDASASSGVLFSARPSTNLGSGDALGEFRYFRRPEIASAIEARPEAEGNDGLEALAREAASRALEDVYAVDPISAADLREALHPGYVEPPEE